jgi:hypothetical protein
MEEYLKMKMNGLVCVLCMCQQGCFAASSFCSHRQSVAGEKDKKKTDRCILAVKKCTQEERVLQRRTMAASTVV